MTTSSLRWLLAAALAAPLAATAQVLPSTSVSTTTTATVPGVAVPGAARVATGTAHMATAYHAAPPEQRAARMSQQLAQELHLDAATTAKVQAAALLRAQKIDAIQMGAASNKEKNTALQANAQEYKAALQAILTPAQFAQYTAKMGKAKVAAGANAEVSGE